MRIAGRNAPLWLVVGAFILGTPVMAQETDRSAVVVVGSVEDRSEGGPLAQVSVRLVSDPRREGSVPQVVAELLTGTDGRFTTAPLAPGFYRIQIQFLGYQTVDERILVDGASPMDIQVELSQEAIALDGIVVVSRRSRVLENEGFYQRRQQGFGRTFTRDEIRQRGATATTDILRMVPGLSLASPNHMSSPYVFLRGGCRPDIIMDGLNLGPDVPIDDIMPAWNLEGLEVHRAATVPIRFRGNPCGAVIMWTIDPSAQEPGSPFSWRRLMAAGGFVVLSFLLTR